ncbi:MAG: hemolysin family protein, partial [Oscillospiraceae bacterium]
TILVGNNVVNIGSTAIATLICSRLFGEQTGAAVSTVVMTILVLTFGEILPKSFAKANSEKLSLAFANILNILMIVFTPVVSIFVKLTTLISKNAAADDKPSVTEQELKCIIESIEEEGVLEEEESELVQSALEFYEITVQEMLTPRVDMVTLDVEDRWDYILKIVEEEGYTRMPVYRDTIDNIIGIVRVRDILLEAVNERPVELEELLRPCKYVHKTMKIGTLLNELKKEKTHIAIVTDDYGGTMGMVTMEDILEELVGEIWDEYDDIEDDMISLDDDLYEVSGDCNIYDLFDKLEIDERGFESDFHTVGGWTLEQFGRIPSEGDSFSYKQLNVTVLKVDEQRVIKLKIQRKPELKNNED